MNRVERSVWRLSGMAACLLLLAVGCGPRGARRVDVEGEVRYAGQPLRRGVIRFDPDGAKGNKGPVGYAEIIDGRFTTRKPGAKGPLTGPLVVWITGYRPTDASREAQLPLFSDYRAEAEITPAAPGPTRLEFDVPEQRATK